MFNPSQLPKILISLVMSGKEIDCYEEVMAALAQQMDKLDSNGTFLTVMALSKQVIQLESVPGDIFYLLYMNVIKHFAEFNVFDLSHIIGFFSMPVVSEKIPLSFWETNVPEVIKTGMENYVIYGVQKEVIEKGPYLTDLISCLIAYSFGPSSDPQFWKISEKFLLENISDVLDKTFEHLIFVFTRTY